MTHVKWCLAVGLMVVSIVAGATECSATTTRRVPLLELYTSQGCNSCPPTDRWVVGLPVRGLASDRLVTLAFHVDYWNYLGWPDPYARAEYSERQRSAARRNAARFVYTPQLLLNGRDYRRGLLRDDLGERVAAVNRDEPAASISLTLKTSAEPLIAASGEARVQQSARRIGAFAYLALYENRLSTQVLAGENRGRRLEHDFVVRDLAGPFALDAQGSARLVHGFHVDRAWKRDDLNVAAFVQNEASGEVLQALVVARCTAR